MFQKYNNQKLWFINEYLEGKNIPNICLFEIVLSENFDTKFYEVWYLI